MDGDEARRLIEAERDETVERIASLTHDLEGVAAAAADSNLDDEHDPEGATVAFEREQLAALRDRAVASLAELDAALVRVDDSTYGTCETCGGAISDERLAALPATRVCVTCARR